MLIKGTPNLDTFEVFSVHFSNKTYKTSQPSIPSRRRYLFCFVSGSKKLDKVIVKVSPQCCCDDFWESTAVIVTAVKIFDDFLEESSSS